MAASTRCFGLLLELAPESSSTVIPFFEGIGVAIQGRSIPAILPNPRRAAVTAAPVLPGATTASHWPSRTSRVATTIEASFFLRTAWTGCSPISMTSLAWTMDRRSLSFASYCLSTLRIFCSSPTSTTSNLYSLTAWMAPRTISSGA